MKKPDGKAGALCYKVKSQDRERERNIPIICLEKNHKITFPDPNPRGHHGNFFK